MNARLAAPPLLTLQDVALTFGGTPLITGADLSIAPGDRTCLVGRNGSGKSTLMRIAAGLAEPDRGRRFVQPGTTIRYLAQEPDFSGVATVLDFVEAGLAPGDPAHRARTLLESLGLTGAEDPARLSGGEGRRAALAQALAPEPDVLLLDEPTNHLDLPAIEWLEAELRATRSALVLISHDRRFLSSLSRATVWLDRGETRRIERGFSEFEAWRDAFFEEEERDQHKLDRKIAAEEHWLRYGVTARRKRNVRRLGNLQALRQDRREARRPVGQVSMQAGEAEASGSLVVEARGIAKAYGPERAIVAGLSLRVMRGDRLGIVGANGAGKSTLIGLLTGTLAPDSGAVMLGTNLRPVILDQTRSTLEPGMSVTDVLTGGRGDSVTVNGQSRHVIGYLKDFLFSPEQARTPVSVLSGGERNRLLIARALAQPSNLLVLDEPTNDLDLETLDLLQEMLGDYPGTLILVSHDRDFLDRVAGSVLVSEGAGRWVEYAGGYTDMLAQRGVGVEARAPAGRADKARPGKPERAARPASPTEKPRLGFKDQHELKTLPERIVKLEAAIAQLKGILDDPDLYARDPARFEKASVTLAHAQGELSAAEDRWLELEMLREG